MKSLALALCLLAPLARAEDPWKGGTIPMVFSGTDVGHALKAIGLRTGTPIVYAAGKEKINVSLNVTAASPAEAVRCVASAGGLVVRQVGRMFVVALPAAMRQALEPYCVRATLPVGDADAAELAKDLQEAFPYATLRPGGDRISIFAVPEDVEAARGVLREFQEGAAARRPATDVVLLAHATASKVAPLLAALYPDVKVVPTPGDGPGGALSFSGAVAGVEAARDTARKLDAQAGTDGPVLRVYNLRYASASAVVDFLKQAAPAVEAFAGPEAFLPKRAGFNPLAAGMANGSGFFGAGTGAQAGGGSPATGGQAVAAPTEPTTDGAKTLVLRGRGSDVDEALRLLAQVDRKPRQIVVDVHVIETSPENDEAVGVLYDWKPFNFVDGPATSNRPVGVGRLGRAPLDFTATLNARVVRKQARILAKPTIQVVDNGQASVFVGDTIRARLVTQGALGAQNVEIESFPVGIILLIAPRVNADGNITMHVNPVVSTVTAIDGNNIPQTSVREAETTAIVKSGETVVLGGLIREDDVKTVTEVPFLSRLPLVGQLFRNRARNQRRTDILVSITPHLVEDEP